MVKKEKVEEKGMNKALKVTLIVISVVLLLVIGTFYYGLSPLFNPAPAKCDTLVTEEMPLEGLSNFVTYYYLNPNSSQIISSINTMNSNNLLTVQTTAAFFAQIFVQNPTLVNKWIMQDLCGLQGLKINSWDALVSSLWLANIPETKAILSELKINAKGSYLEYIDYYLINEPENLKTMTVKTALDLDMLWAAFFATGNEVYVQQIITTLDYSDSANDDLYSVAKSAAWSLTSNAEQHKKVLQIIEKEINISSNSKIKLILQEIVNTATK